MTEIPLRIEADKKITIGTVVNMAGENKAVKLLIEVPSSFMDYSKYVEFRVNEEPPVMSAEIPPGSTEFSVFLLRQVLKKGSLLVQLVCKKGEEIWKSYTKLLHIAESINATEYIVDAGKDILQDISDRLVIVEHIAGLGVATEDTLGVIKVGSNLKILDGVLSVDTASLVQQDNTKPITSAAVYTELGNIEALLGAI